MNVEILETQKQDTELIIQGLHKTADILESARAEETQGTIKDLINSFLKQTEKEIEWNEEILQEINESIGFEEQRAIDNMIDCDIEEMRLKEKN
jgi:hypothetical protein